MRTRAAIAKRVQRERGGSRNICQSRSVTEIVPKGAVARDFAELLDALQKDREFRLLS
jgi:hypothetical protein